MITANNIKIDTKPKGLVLVDKVVRHVSKEDEEDTGWRFQGIIKNDTSSSLADLEFALRYYDSSGSFLGMDEGFSLGTDKLSKGDDKSISIELNFPSGVSRSTLVVRAEPTNWFQEHSFLLGMIIAAIAAIFYFLGEFMSK